MSLPLSGLRILDFSTLLPGPYATQLLADMGAEVLRIEAPKRPDLLKSMPPRAGKVSAAHASINRNKKSLALDLKHEDAAEIVAKLLPEYDIVVEQFRPGVMARLGLGYEDLVAINPKVIYCSISGYGQTGPYRDRAGHDINYLALSGLASYSGRVETGPVLSATQIADIAGGSHHAVMAILAAVIARTTTGEGQHLDISMSDAALALNTMFAANAKVSGQSPEAGKEMLNGGLFYDYYQTSDGRYMSIGSLEPNFAMGLMAALELQDHTSKIADPRPESQASLRAAIADKIAAQPLDHWTSLFGSLDVCVEPVLTLGEAFENEHFQARQMSTVAEDSEGNEIPQVQTALPFKRARHQAGVPLGANTDEVLANLGYADAKISELKAQGTVK